LNKAAPWLLLGVTCLVLSACSGGQQRGRFSDKAVNRALAYAPGAAQPSSVVKAELEYARAARERSLADAAGEFVGPGGVIHGTDGPVDAATFFATSSDGAAPKQWEPRSVWMSCSGALAVSQGRYIDSQGLVGNYVTVWQQQSDRSYKFVYGLSGPDSPQPLPKPAGAEPGPNDIVVTALDAVAGLVADCPRGGTPMPIAPAVAITDDASQGGRMSRDGTLRWRWEHGGPAERRIIVEWLTSGKWQVGLDETLPALQK